MINNTPIVTRIETLKMFDDKKPLVTSTLTKETAAVATETKSP